MSWERYIVQRSGELETTHRKSGLGIILALTLGLMVPLGMVSQLIHERAARQDAVVNEIAASSAGAQRLIGPILVLPYQEEYAEDYWEKETIDGELKRVRRTRQVRLRAFTGANPI
ncbi:inner membrane protein [Thiorhodovibrio litoralis]|nr:inner membrane protein [Thiorhodovibrio litoralis]